MRTLIVSLTAIGCLCAATTSSAATYKVAWYNIQSGNGERALNGHTTPFVENTNCIDSTQPLNAWGTGFVQAELEASIGRDSAVIALGLAEAWRCGTPENVRRSLNWKARTGERNGTAIVARHGFSGPEQWTELDTSLNLNTKDTMWVVRVPVCVDAACSASVIVYAAHWLGTGPNDRLTYGRQADGTLLTMSGDAARPHVLVGDLNVFEGATTGCGQIPNNDVLLRLSGNGYVDAWPVIHSTAEGYTGMVNRAGCGVPEGYVWKRVDYAWVKGYRPAGMTRFGITPPGDAAPSDHYGIIVTIADGPSPAVPDPREIVLHASEAHARVGAWTVEGDPTAAGGRRLRHANAGAPKLNAPLAVPANYFELSFYALAGEPYRLWLRGRADANHWANDSVYVQFDEAVAESGTSLFRIGTTSATTLVLEDATNAVLDGWGWQDNGYGPGVLGPAVRFARTGMHTLRVQTREDGLAIDQLVLSAGRYLFVPPGPPRRDATLLP